MSAIGSLLRRLGPLDLRSVRRDPLLAWVAVLPIFLALLYGTFVPWLRELLLERFGFELAPYYPLIMSTFVTAAPGVVGMVIGFLLIDERDAGVLRAIAVTAVGPSDYLLYRLVAPVAVGFVMTVLCYPLIGLTPLPLLDLLAIAAVGSLVAPPTALFLAAFAENKVAAFALVKISNTLNMMPIAAWFFDIPLQWLAGVIPGYWPMKMLWQAAAGESYGGYAVGGVAAAVAVSWWLMRRFRRRLDRAAF
jgi:fluoroquinolone transport system permease protein